MSTKNTTENTSIQEVEVDDSTINEILGMPGAENIMIPSKESKKPSIFSNGKVDMSFIENDEKEESVSPAVIAKETTDSKEIPAPSKKETVDSSVNKEAIQDVLDEINSVIDEENSTTSGTGRPKVDKSGLIDTVNKLVEKGILFPFDDDKPLEKYTTQDFLELIEVNMAEKEKAVRESTPLEFFDSLPEELQYAAKYVADGGQDLKSLFRVLAQTEEIKDLDVSDDNDQEVIVRNYLSATRFGTPEEIEEEIDAWKDRGELGNKASKFKPKLDNMQAQIVARKLQEQEVLRKNQEQAAQYYTDSVYKTLEDGTLNGLKLDKKTQGMLFSGLIQPNYPSASGRPTNLLGHLLERYQYGTKNTKPRHDLIAEALWLLADPESYKNKIKEGSVKEANEKTVRLLKTEQSNRNSSTNVSNDEPESSGRVTKKLSRNAEGGSFFRRD